MDRPTFANAWSRVNRLTPTLRPHVQVRRQLYRGEPWHVVHDPITNSFFRLNPVDYYFVGLLDGRRSVDDAWRLTLDRYGDDAPTQNEVIGLLGQLNESNLLRVDLPADAEPLLRRKRTRVIRQWGGQAANILFLRIPVFNPDRMLTWLSPIVRPLLSRVGLIIWALWVALALAIFLPHLGEFIGDTQSVLAPANWGWMALLFILIKAFHELGHGLICKRFKCPVPETGVMLLVLFPAPFVDATSAWGLPDKWQRLLVGAGGMMFELVAAGAAAIAWVYLDDGVPRQLCYNLVFLASVTTILFNANPLLRFDGYYMLSDLLEIPNLYDRAGRHLRYLACRYAFGLESAQPVSTGATEAWILSIYGIGAQIYRAIVMFGIAFYIAKALPLLGIIIALWSVIAWGIWPCCKFVHWLASNPALDRRRTRAVVVTALATLALVVGLGQIRFAEHVTAEGVVDSTRAADVAAGSDGFIVHAMHETGDVVKKSEVLYVAQYPDLLTRKKILAAQLDGLIADRMAQLGANELVKMHDAEARMKPVREALADVKDRIDALTIRASQDGVLAGPPAHNLVGLFVRRGQVIGRIVDPASLRVTAMVEQSSSDPRFFEKISQVEVRTAGRIDQAFESRMLWHSTKGTTELPFAALGYNGGGTIATDSHDQHGLTSLRPLFEVWLSLPQALPDALLPTLPMPGQRVYVRFTMKERRPLVYQWVHKARQMIRDRLEI